MTITLSVQPIMKQLGRQVTCSQAYSLSTCDTSVMDRSPPSWAGRLDLICPIIDCKEYGHGVHEAIDFTLLAPPLCEIFCIQQLKQSLFGTLRAGIEWPA